MDFKTRLVCCQEHCLLGLPDGALRRIRGKGVKESFKLSKEMARLAKQCYAHAMCLSQNGLAVSLPNKAKIIGAGITTKTRMLKANKPLMKFLGRDTDSWDLFSSLPPAEKQQALALMDAAKDVGSATGTIKTPRPDGTIVESTLRVFRLTEDPLTFFLQPETLPETEFLPS